MFRESRETVSILLLCLTTRRCTRTLNVNQTFLASSEPIIKKNLSAIRICEQEEPLGVPKNYLKSDLPFFRALRLRVKRK